MLSGPGADIIYIIGQVLLYYNNFFDEAVFLMLNCINSQIGSLTGYFPLYLTNFTCLGLCGILAGELAINPLFASSTSCCMHLFDCFSLRRQWGPDQKNHVKHKDLVIGKHVLFTELQYSAAFRSYRILKFGKLVGFLIKKDMKVEFSDVLCIFELLLHLEFNLTEIWNITSTHY